MSDYGQYYKKGGTYELPTAIFNDIVCELEELQKQLKEYKQKEEKIRKYINNSTNFLTFKDTYIAQELLKIIDGSEEDDNYEEDQKKQSKKNSWGK